MKGRMIIAGLVGLIALAVAAPAGAWTPTFSTADLQGRWQVSGVTVTTGGVYSTLFYGTIHLDGQGGVLSGTLFYPEQYGKGDITSGSFRLGDEGDLSGNLTFFDSAANNDLVVLDGRMSLDKNIITIIGRHVTSSGGLIYGKWTLSRIP